MSSFIRDCIQADDETFQNTYRVISELTASGQYHEALKVLNRTTASFERQGNFFGKVRCQLLQAALLIDLDKFEDGLSTIQAALDVFSSEIIASTLTSFLKSPKKDLKFLTFVAAAWCEQTRALEGLARFDEALKVLDEIEQQLLPEFSLSNCATVEVQVLRIKGSVLKNLGKLDDARVVLEKSLELARRFGVDDGELVGHIINTMGNVFLAKGDLDLALQHFQNSLEKYQQVAAVVDVAKVLNNIGVVHAVRGELDHSLQYFEKSLRFYRQLGSQRDIAMALNNIGNIHFNKGNYSRALEHYHQSLQLYQAFGNLRDVSHCLQNIGNVHRSRGGLDQALSYFHQSLELREKIGNQQDVAAVLWTIGNAYRSAGERSKAITALERSLTIRQEINNPQALSESLFSLIITLLEGAGEGDSQKLQDYFDQLRECVDKDPGNPVITQRYLICKSLMLLNQAQHEARRLPQLQLLLEAELILEQLVSDPVVDHELTITASLVLCQHLLRELRRAPHPEIPRRITDLLNDLLVVSKDQGSHLLVTELYWLQAKFFLFQGEFQKASDLMTQAQLTAEERGFNSLLNQILQEQEELVSFLDKKAPQSRFDLNDLLRMAALNDVTLLEEFISRIMRGSLPVTVTQQLEIPVLFMVLGTNGILLYTMDFSSDLSVNPYLLSNFLSAIRTFSQEIFSQTLNHMKIGEYTVTMLSDRKLVFVYAFKGSSQSAFEKMKAFHQELSRNEELITSLEHASLFAMPIGSVMQDSLSRLVESIFNSYEKKTLAIHSR